MFLIEKLLDVQKVLLVLIKMYLLFFVDWEDDVGEFVRGLIEYVKSQKFLMIYIGLEDEGNGFW